MSHGLNTITASFDTQELDTGVVGEGVEHAHGVAATTDASDDSVGQLATLLEHLLLRLVTDDGLEGSHNSGEGMRADGGSDDVVSCVELGDPGAKGFVDSVTQGFAASFDGDNLGAEEANAEDVESLATDILL